MTRFRRLYDVYNETFVPVWKDMQSRIELIRNKLHKLEGWFYILRKNTDAAEIYIGLEEALKNISILQGDILTLTEELDYLEQMLYDYSVIAEMELERVGELLSEDKGTPDDNKGK